MKKNRTMRVAALMLALTLITSSFVGGTFAKYLTSATIGGNTSSGDGSSARVAKFGVEIAANTNGESTGDAISLFKKEYESNGEVVVKSEDAFVVAPGTSNADATGTDSALFGLTITGKPEVAVNVNYIAEISLGADATNVNGPWVLDDGSFYCPLIFTIGGQEYSGLDYDSLAAFEGDLETAISLNQNFDPGTDLATALAGDANTVNRANFSISWEWPFEGDGVNQTDEKDTQLGNAAAATADAADTFSVSFAITASVTQINDIR